MHPFGEDGWHPGIELQLPDGPQGGDVHGPLSQEEVAEEEDFNLYSDIMYAFPAASALPLTFQPAKNQEGSPFDISSR